MQINYKFNNPKLHRERSQIAKNQPTKKCLHDANDKSFASFDEKWGSKILIAVVLFIFSYCTFSYLSPVSYAEDDASGFFWTSYYKDLVDEQMTEAGYDSDDNRSPNWDNIFGKTGKKNGKNLYLLVYNKIKKEPADNALAEAAAYFGYSEDDMLDIMDGDLTQMWKFDSSIAVYQVEHNLESLDGVYEKYKAITGYYNQVLSNEIFKSELETKTLVQEIFANGTTEDSGFDLIVDLQIIEYILFSSTNESGYGGNGGSGLGSGSDGDALERNQTDDSSGSEDAENPETETVELEATEIGTDDIEAEAKSQTEIVDDKAECFEDTELDQILNDFLDSGVSGVVDESGDIDASGDEQDGASPSDGEEEDSVNNDENNNGTASADAGSEDPESSDWSRFIPCNEFICLEINFVSGSDEPEYEETTNCIDCHFTYIAETLDEVTSHSLTPGKVPGNIAEDATCKEASINLLPSFKVFAISSPIITPSNDDIVIDVWKIGENFMSVLKPDREEEYDPDDLTSNISDADLNALRLLDTESSETVNIIEYGEKIADLTYANSDARLQEMNELEISTQMQDMTTMYQTVETEMFTMDMIFFSIETTLWDILDNLNVLKEKGYQQ